MILRPKCPLYVGMVSGRVYKFFYTLVGKAGEKRSGVASLVAASLQYIQIKDLDGVPVTLIPISSVQTCTCLSNGPNH